MIANPWNIITAKLWCNNRTVKSHHIKQCSSLTIKNKKKQCTAKSQIVWPFNNKNKKCIEKSQLVRPSNLNLHAWMRIIHMRDKRMSIVESVSGIFQVKDCLTFRTTIVFFLFSLSQGIAIGNFLLWCRNQFPKAPEMFLW